MNEDAEQCISDIGKKIESGVGGSSPVGMLEILRQLAICRVRTVITNFDNIALDAWILSTGYLDLGSPPNNGGLTNINDDLWLISIWAASICNTRAPTPDAISFGKLMHAAMSMRGPLSPPPSVQGLASLALKTGLPLPPDWYEGLVSVEAGKIIPTNNSIMTAQLIRSVIEFSTWLFVQGGAKWLYEFLLYSPHSHISSVLSLVNSLSSINMAGIAVSINFLKDVGAPLLVSKGITLGNARQYNAGWVGPKPDRHVIRLVPRVTRYDPKTSTFESAPQGNFMGKYYSFVPIGPKQDRLRIVADVWEWADTTGTSPLEIDRVLYVLGAKKVSVLGQIVQAQWYHNTEKIIDAAITAKVPRNS